MKFFKSLEYDRRDADVKSWLKGLYIEPTARRVNDSLDFFFKAGKILKINKYKLEIFYRFFKMKKMKIFIQSCVPIYEGILRIHSQIRV